jgi:transcriptional regulator with XRE-family HTH domain
MHREKLGLSQAELARRSKISLTTLNELESRSFRDIRLSTLVALSQNLKLPVAALFYESDLDFASSSDQAQFLKASETLSHITKKIKSRTKSKS